MRRAGLYFRCMPHHSISALARPLMPFVLALLTHMCAGQLGPRHIIHHLAQGVAGEVIVLDADGDGDDDLVNSLAPLSRIYLNDGAGGFDEQHVLFDSSITYVLFAGEANGDGLTDLFIRQGSSYRFALSDGTGDFVPVPDPYIETGGMECHAFDADGDDRCDVVCARNVDGDAMLLENNGSGLLGPPTFVAISNFALPETGDVDGDGDEDVIVLRTLMFAVMLNLGQSVFQEVTFPIGATRQASISDIDQDGMGDIVLSTGTGQGPYTLSVMHSLGDGLFDPALAVDTLFDANGSFRVEDLDGDAFPDLYYGEDDTLKWYRNDGNGVLLPVAPMVPGFNKAYWLVDEQWTMDRENDGDRDIVVRLRDGPHLCAVEQTAPGSFAEVPQWLVGSYTLGGVESADMDGDLDLDLVTFGYSIGSFNAEVINFWRNDGTLDFAPRQMIADSAITILDMALTDLDMDGDRDVVCASSSMGSVFWLENDGTGTFSPKQTCFSSTSAPKRFDATDVTGDGAPDLLAIYATSDELHLYVNDGTGQFGSPQVISSSLNWPHEVKCADMDGDGDADAVVADGNAGLNNQVLWLANDGTGTFTGPLSISALGEVATLLTIADVDNDGDNDLVYDRRVNSTSTDVRVALNDGSGSFTPTTVTTLDDQLSDLRLTDISGDGHPDVLLCGDSDPYTYLLANNGSGTFASPVVLTDQQQWPQAALAVDIDGDGLRDLVTASGGDQQLSWYANTGFTTGIAATSAPASVVFPNPMSDAARIVFTGPVPADARIDLLDASGRVLRSIRGYGSREVLIERGHLESGLYVLQVVRGSGHIGSARIVIH